MYFNPQYSCFESALPFMHSHMHLQQFRSIGNAQQSSVQPQAVSMLRLPNKKHRRR